MKEITISELLADFDKADAAREATPKLNECVSIKLTPEAKARFDILQQKSRKKFGKKLRAVILALIDAGEAKTA